MRPNAKPYRYNDGTLIKDERDEKWSKDGGTIKVGYGRGGNGDVGAAFPGGLPRIMTNAVEEFGDGKTKYTKKPDEGRADAPPERTLVYDFDKKDENSGAGSGRYAPVTMVSVTADPAPAGQHFAGWTGDIVILSNPNITTTTAIIPSMDVGITATYRTNAQIRGSPGEESFGLSASSLDEHRADWVPGLPAEQ